MKILSAVVIFISSYSAIANLNFSKDFSLKPVKVESLMTKLTSEILAASNLPKELEFEQKNYVIDYSLDKTLEKFLRKELRRYSSDYASVVIIDNNTSKIISAIDYTRKNKSFGKNLTFSSTHPAASVFKVVTGVDLIQNHNIIEDTPFTYNGKATTLYKYQLKNKQNKWTRKSSFEQVFAKSNNVIFAKAALAHSNFKSLTKTAKRLGFEQDILPFLKLDPSRIFSQNTDYGLAELASGFNDETMISPVHGAVIASIIANNGILKKPSIVNSVKDLQRGRLIWEVKEEEDRVISQETAERMQSMMELAVSKGTARSAFRKAKSKRLKSYSIGGKTGTLTGGIPFGKRDWFISYAMPKSGDDKGISVCVMIVNLKKWYVKSSVLAKNIIEYYYSRKKTIN